MRRGLLLVASEYPLCFCCNQRAHRCPMAARGSWCLPSSKAERESSLQNWVAVVLIGKGKGEGGDDESGIYRGRRDVKRKVASDISFERAGCGVFRKLRGGIGM